MTGFFFVVEFILAIIITIAVLLQKSSSIGLGAYSGSNESLFGAKGPSGFLAKFTLAVGLLFVANTICLSYLYNQQISKSVIDDIEKTSAPSAPSTGNAPITPSAPEAPSAQ
ncbi:MAG: preprotein translocase subunit SecG [Campylobacteraceae bacterium]|jgi:preprotein translocase subunit SecG|nr:preprotein translocase subunit SecG [Campylobacteraceae bacterium]